MEELDLSNANPEDLAEYSELTNQILATNDPELRKELLKQRAIVMSRILKASVYPIVD